MVKYKELYELSKEEMNDRWYNGGKAWKPEQYGSAFQMAPRIDELTERFASIKLIRDEDNKVLATPTLNKLRDEDEELFYLVLFTGTYPRRAGIILDSVRHCSLVPPLMSAHKEVHNVMYEEWNKQDKGISYAVGAILWHDIKHYLQPIPNLDDNLLELRKPNCFVKSGPNKGNPKTLTGNTFANIVYEDGFVSGKSLAVYIKGQFWNAHVSKRNKYMILDTTNWDNMPKAFDVYHVESDEQKKKVNKTVQKSMTDFLF